MLRPTTTARRPSSSTPASANRAITPAGVQLRGPGSPFSSRPRLRVWRPSASLSGSITASRGPSASPVGSGSCNKMPSTAGSALSLLMQACTSVAGVVAARWAPRLRMPIRLQAFSLLATYTPLAGSSPTRSTASPGGRPAASSPAATTACSRCSILAARRRPSRRVAITPLHLVPACPGPGIAPVRPGLARRAFD